MLTVTNFGSDSGPAAFLPSDILEIIFLFLLEEEKSNIVFTRRTAPHNISGVNRNWRDAALHRKSLWSTLIADLSSPATISQHLMHFRCYLERCGSTLPIDITITAFANDDVVVGSATTGDDDDSYSIKSEALPVTATIETFEGDGAFDVDNVSDTTDDNIVSVVTFNDDATGISYTTDDEDTIDDEPTDDENATDDEDATDDENYIDDEITTDDEYPTDYENFTDYEDVSYADGYSTRSDGADEASREPAPSFSMLAMDRCMDLLAPQCTRWRNVKLVFPRNTLSTDIMASYMCSTWPITLKGLTSLRNLHFDFPDSTQYDPAILDLSDSQLIECAYVSGLVHLHLDPHVTLPNLSHLTLNLFRKPFDFGLWAYRAPDYRNWVFKVLEQMPNLTSLSVVTTFGCPLTDHQYKEPPVTLASLLRLEVTCKGVANNTSYHDFLYSISCPSLEELIISSTVYAPNECWMCVPISEDRPRFYPFGVKPPLPEDFMRTAGGTLEKLSIDCDFLIVDHLLRALTFSPGLRHLYIANSRYHFDSNVAALLTHERVTFAMRRDENDQEVPYSFSLNGPDESLRHLLEHPLVSRDFCPRLESMTFVSPPCACSSVDDDALQRVVDMIATRWDKLGSPLRSFKVLGRETEGFDEHPTIKRIRSSHRYCSPEWVVNI